MAGSSELHARGTAPTITASPTNRFVLNGSNVSFSVTAVGTPPLAYEWFFNSNILAGQTASQFTLTNVEYTNSGVYSVTVSNGYGAAISSNAVLFVRGPQFGSGGVFRASTHSFTFSLNGLTGHGPVVIYTSTDLVHWLAIYTNPPVVGTMQFTDTNAAFAPVQFYDAGEQ